MRSVILMLALLALSSCGEALTTPEGCPIYMTEIMQAETRACQQAYYEERARMNGGTVTKCFGGPGQLTCVSQ